jgi:nitroimidazol reductase NimA-like FMN-containing flavoprotein (pyridoxamine 5'-phosphate oxidase superfamily)
MTKLMAPDRLSGTLDALSERECRRLLGTHTLGRVGITSGGLPCIVPVCYRYSEGAIVFRTGGGTNDRPAASGDVLAFEVDSYDPQSGEGWSVLVLGRASVVTNEDEHDCLRPLGGPHDHSERNHLVRLSCELVTGRVIEPATRF